MVGQRGGLPDLSPFLPGFQWRRHRRSEGHHQPPRLSCRPWRGRAVAVPGLQVPAGRQRLRHLRLPGHRSAVRHDGRYGRAACRSAQARPEGHHGPGREPHVRRARLVPGFPRQERPARRLVLVASCQAAAASRALRAPSRTSGAPTSAAPHGSTTRSAANTSSTSTPRSSPTSTGRIPRCARPSTR